MFYAVSSLCNRSCVWEVANVRSICQLFVCILLLYNQKERLEEKKEKNRNDADNYITKIEFLKSRIYKYTYLPT